MSDKYTHPLYLRSTEIRNFCAQAKHNKPLPEVYIADEELNSTVFCALNIVPMAAKDAIFSAGESEQKLCLNLCFRSKSKTTRSHSLSLCDENDGAWYAYIVPLPIILDMCYHHGSLTQYFQKYIRNLSYARL